VIPAAADLDLLATEIESDLRATMRGFLADQCASGAVTALYDGDRTLVAPLWKALTSDLGLAGLLVPEELGGAGASAREAGVVLEELGRVCAPVPFLTSAVVATSVLAACDSEGAAEVLGHLATGASTAALLVPLSLAPDGVLPAFAAADGCVSGNVRSAAGVLDADLLLVPVPGDNGVALHLVSREHASVTAVSSLDMTRQVADVWLDGAPTRVLATDAEAALRVGLLVGAALLASEQVGLARWCLDETVAYLKVRRQFGRVVGGFQALKHRLADLYAEVESASAAARYAAAALAAGEDVPVAARVAAAYCGDVAVHAAEEAVQLHGGIGMTWEHPAHLYLKRAKADQIALGTPGAHRQCLADIVELPGVVT
jgi:alkylation response protein AidB-like acyl-CoA dehydrogenase